MNRRGAIGVFGVVVLLLLTAVGLFITAPETTPGGAANGVPSESVTPTHAASPAEKPATATGTRMATRTTAPRPFTFSIEAIDSCGPTCRDVTGTVTNSQRVSATDVVIIVRLYAGKNTTADDELLWESSRQLGTLAPGESATTTERVELSFRDGLAIEGANGWITLHTTVRSAERTFAFSESVQAS